MSQEPQAVPGPSGGEPPATPGPTDPTVGPGQLGASPAGPAAERPGAIIGPYRLLQVIGEGGFGTVFLAEQTHPVRRQVALKIIKLGMDTRQVVARFEAERQALAVMDHPHIAKVLDAGATGSGRPYFVMELVRGVPITDYCDANQLTVDARLDLFAQVCDAVQHAHTKGVIHRDLKPGNVLVALADGKPAAKVIDFGIAKAIDRHLTEHTLFTEFRQMVGTPEYMSPEQAEMAGLDIDTRTDVYSLGVMLYELLVGTTPIDARELRSKAYADMQRMIREVDPPAPSTRLSSLGERLPTVAARRRLEPRRLARVLRGELDWVCLRAMEKDRARRYESAGALAEDLRRYLRGEAVVAAPPGWAYRAGKFVRRHKATVTAAGLVLAALVLGVIGTTIGLVRATRAREAEVARADGERRARDLAEKRLRQSERANELLGSVFKDLDPRSEQLDGRPLRAVLGERLERAFRDLDADAVADPLPTARLQVLLARAQIGLGQPDRAVALLTRARATFAAALGPGDPESLGCTHTLATAHFRGGRADLAIPLYEDELRLRKARLAAGHTDVPPVPSMSNLGLAYQEAGQPTKALPLMEEVYAYHREHSGPEHPDTLASMDNLAVVLHEAGQLPRAMRLYQEALRLRRARLGPDHPDTLSSLNNLASGLASAGEPDQALAMYEEAYKGRRAKLGADHPETLVTLQNLASTHRDAGHLDKALPYAEEAYERLRARLGPEHPHTLSAMSTLGLTYLKLGQPARGLPLLEGALDLRKARLGASHPSTLATLGSLATAYAGAGKLDQALPLFQQSFDVQRAALGPDHPSTLSAMSDLGAAYAEAEQFDRALPLLEEAVKRQTAVVGADHPDTLLTVGNLAAALGAAGRYDRAATLLEETLPACRKRLGEAHPTTLALAIKLGTAYSQSGRSEQGIRILQDVHQAARDNPALAAAPELAKLPSHLARAYDRAGHYPKSEPLYRQAVEEARAATGDQSPRTASARSGLAQNLLRQHKGAEAEPVSRACLAAREKLDPDRWTTFHAKSLLGGALLEQKKFADAEPLLLAGYEGMKQRQDKIPPEAKGRLQEAHDRVVRLYQEWGKPTQADEWQKK